MVNTKKRRRLWRTDGPILNASTETLLRELKKVDPIMADRWHPNDRRKIQRSLTIYLQTGRPASEIYAEQRQRAVDTNEAVGGEDVVLDRPAMRFPTLLFWTHTANEALRTRLDERVDKMVERGLAEEADVLERHLTSRLHTGEVVDVSRGIWVSIGYKEFRDYLKTSRDPSATDASLHKLQTEAIERTKISTRQYAKRQTRWIRIKLVNALADAGATDQLYLLDSSDVSRFSETVITPAMTLADQFLKGEPMQKPDTLCAAAAEQLQPKQEWDLAATPNKWFKQHCHDCDTTCVTEAQWMAHSKSKAHRKLTSKRKQASQSAQPAQTGLELG